MFPSSFSIFLVMTICTSFVKKFECQDNKTHFSVDKWQRCSGDDTTNVVTWQTISQDETTIGFDICAPKQAQAQAGGPTERHAEARGLCLSFLIFEATAVVQSHIIWHNHLYVDICNIGWRSIELRWLEWFIDRSPPFLIPDDFLRNHQNKMASFFSNRPFCSN